ncbi:hypothetical protein [Nonomuraea phyllanthi]|nr:hypothetical protein [Nonomuraea phyllanthi]
MHATPPAQEPAAKGWTISSIAQKPRLDRHTVRKFARAEAVGDLLTFPPL